MDQMEITKIVGAACSALLVLMLFGWASETIYHVGGGHGDHGEHEMAYIIETDEGDDEAVEEEVIDMVALVAMADSAKGEKGFRKCSSCHKLGEGAANGVGPQLNAVLGRAVGSIDGFGYSGVLADHGGAWEIENLSAFLENPKGYAPGTKMAFNGLKKPEDRANLIAYLEAAAN